MRRILHIALAATLAAICVLPASGQDYRRNKVRVEPEPLEFRKTYWLPGLSPRDQRALMNKWDFKEYELKNTGGPAYNDGLSYFLSVHNLDFKKVKGTVMGNVIFLFNEGYLTLEFNNITIDWKNHLIIDMSQEDSRLNRPWLWRVNHNPVIVNTARERCREIFDTICASMDEFIKDGPPLELKPL